MLCFCGRHKVLFLVLPGEWCSRWKVVLVNFFPRCLQDFTGGNPVSLPLLWRRGWNGCDSHCWSLQRQAWGAEPALPCPTCTGVVVLQPRRYSWSLGHALPCVWQGCSEHSWQPHCIPAAAFCPLALILSAVITPICWTLLSQVHSWPQSSCQGSGFIALPQEKPFFQGWLGALVYKLHNAHQFWFSPSLPPLIWDRRWCCEGLLT